MTKKDFKEGYSVVKEALVFLILFGTAVTMPNVYLAVKGYVVGTAVALSMVGVPFP